jgi:hypothetical protein
MASGFACVCTYRSLFPCTSYNGRPWQCLPEYTTQCRNKILVICHYHALHTQTTCLLLFLYIIAFPGLAIKSYGLGPISTDHGLKCHLGHAGTFYCPVRALIWADFKFKNLRHTSKPIEVSDLAYIWTRTGHRDQWKRAEGKYAFIKMVLKLRLFESTRIYPTLWM